MVGRLFLLTGWFHDNLAGLSRYVEQSIMIFAVLLGALVVSLALDGLEGVIASKIAKRSGPTLLTPFYERLILTKVDEPTPMGCAKWVFWGMPFLSVALASFFFLDLVPMFFPSFQSSGDLIWMVMALSLASACIAIGCFAPKTNRGCYSGDYELIQLLSIASYFTILFCSLGWFFVQRGLGGEVFTPAFYVVYSPWLHVKSFGALGLFLFLVAFLMIVPVVGKRGVPYPNVGDYRGVGLSLIWTALSLRMMALYSLIVLVFFHPGTLFIFLPPEAAALFMLPCFLLKVFLVRFVGNILAKIFAWSFFNLKSALASYFTMLLVSLVGMLFLVLDALKG